MPQKEEKKIFLGLIYKNKQKKTHGEVVVVQRQEQHLQTAKVGPSRTASFRGGSRPCPVAHVHDEGLAELGVEARVVLDSGKEIFFFFLLIIFTFFFGFFHSTRRFFD